MAGSPIVLLVAGAGAAVALGLVLATAADRKRRFQVLAWELGAEVTHLSGSTMHAEAQGHAMTITILPGGKNTPPHTEVDVRCKRFPFFVELRPTTKAEQKAVARGEAVDLELDDEDFDAAWIVEGAPAESVRALFADEGLRDRLTAFAAQTSASILIAEGAVHLRKLGSDLDGRRPNAMACQLALDLAKAIKKVPPPPSDEVGMGYRTAPEARPSTSTADAIVELKRVRAERLRRHLVPRAIAIQLFAPALLLFMFLSVKPTAHRMGIFGISIALTYAIAVSSFWRTHVKSQRARGERPEPRLRDATMLIAVVVLAETLALCLR